MGLSEDGDENVEQQYEELCLTLNLEANTKDEAWQAFERIKTNYTLEGNELHWLSCALYVACRKTKVPTVGRGVVEGNCVSLTRLLRSSKLSLIQFFNKMKKWCDMSSLSTEFRDKIERLERNFAVSTVIFKKFGPIFLEIFKDPTSDPPRPPRSRKQRRLPCTVTDVFNFCWTMFVQVKGHFPAISDDLVNSYHLLLCCVDWMYSNALQGNRKDLLNPAFSGLPTTFLSKDYKAPSEPQCILELLCTKHDGIVLEAKGIKEHWWKPHIKKLFEKKVLKGGKVENLSGVLELNNFEVNSKAINNAYEEYVLSVGDFDERVFLGEDASEEIGTPAKFAPAATGDLSDEMAVKKNLQLHMEKTTVLGKSTPLTGRRYLRDSDRNNVTPVSTATQGVARLQALLSGCRRSPSDNLMEIFKNDCSRNPFDAITALVSQAGETFCERFAQPSEDHPGSHIDFARQRLQLGESLYYKTLENILMSEKKRLANGNQKIDLSNLLEHDVFHKSLLACCLEIVIFSYNSQRIFPWIVEVFELAPYHFYKVIELLIRSEGELWREVVKHLNCIEESILDSLAWKSDSPLWVTVNIGGGTIPPYEEVSLPDSNTNGSNPLQSPVLRHPAVNRLTGVDSRQSLIMKKDPLQSPTGPSASDRFSSPAAGSAKRRLFGPPSNPISTGTPTTGVSTQPTQLIAYQSVQTTDGKPVLIPVTLIPAQSPQGSSNPGSGGGTPVKGKKKTGSLALFFRKVYHLASVRMKDLCDRLGIGRDLRQKVWTCFENVMVHHSDLLKDRHLDQFIMCSIYMMSKVTESGQSFQEIMKMYRLQPQANSHVYRSVLLAHRHRRTSGGSSDSGGRNGASRSSSPTDADEKEKKRAERLSSIRSTSTLPVPQPNSQPPTPTRMLGVAATFESEDRGDVIKFYNSVFVKKLKEFALKFSSNQQCPALSPMPEQRLHSTSPRRQVSKNHEVYISPIKGISATPLSPASRLLYCFNRSPSKELRAINKMIKMGERKLVGKRLLQEDETDGGAAKKPRLESSDSILIRKLQTVNNDRQEANGGH